MMLNFSLKVGGAIQKSIAIGSTMDRIVIAHLCCTRQMTFVPVCTDKDSEDSVCTTESVPDSVLDCDISDSP